MGGLKEEGAQSSPCQLLPSSSPISFLIFFVTLILLGKCFSITGTRGGMGRWLSVPMGQSGVPVEHLGEVCGVGLGIFMGPLQHWSSQRPHQTGELHPALCVHDPVQHHPHHPAKLQGLSETPTPTCICAVWRRYVGYLGGILGCRGGSLTTERYFVGGWGGVSSLTPIRWFIIVRFR